MRKLLRWTGYALAGLVCLVLVGGAWVWFASERVIDKAHAAAPDPIVQPSPQQLADAERQARILGCFSCHGEGLRGRMMFEEPGVATVWAPNLTEVAARASDAELVRAIRRGIGVDGQSLFVMPSAMYSRLTPAEAAALVAVIRAQPLVPESTPDIEMGPLARFGIATGSFRPVVELVEEFRVRTPWQVPGREAGRRMAGAYCAECHGADLSGGMAGPGVPAPGLSIAASYDLPQFVRLLREGITPSGRDLGLMEEVARADFRHLTDAEIAAIFDYLKARAERVQDPPVEYAPPS